MNGAHIKHYVFVSAAMGKFTAYSNLVLYTFKAVIIIEVINRFATVMVLSIKENVQNNAQPKNYFLFIDGYTCVTREKAVSSNFLNSAIHGKETALGILIMGSSGTWEAKQVHYGCGDKF